MMSSAQLFYKGTNILVTSRRRPSLLSFKTNIGKLGNVHYDVDDFLM